MVALGMRMLASLLLAVVMGHAQPAVARYDTFLREVSSRAAGDGAVLQNGEPSGLVIPDPKEVLGLGDAEWTSLRAIADEFSARVRAFDIATGSLVFDLRLAVAGEEDTSALRRQLDARSAIRERMVGQYVDRMLMELRARFLEVEKFVSSRASGQFFPVRYADGAPRPAAR